MKLFWYLGKVWVSNALTDWQGRINLRHPVYDTGLDTWAYPKDVRAITATELTAVTKALLYFGRLR